jgi:hypothetical protein
MTKSIAERVLPWLLAVYCAASLVHFAHNAEYLVDYPNLPVWLSRADVYLAWVSILAVGLIGYLLYRIRLYVIGLIVLAIYAGLGFDGLLHYTRAPFTSHTIAMNFTIWFEVVAAGVLLIALIKLGSEHLRTEQRTV